MTDDAPVVTPEKEDEQDAQTQDDGPTTFDLAYVQGLRKEAANYRTKLRDVEKSQKDDAEAQLAKDREWETLAEQRASEIEELTPYKQRYDDMVASVAESNTNRIEAVPEQMRGLVPDFNDPLKLATWLDANSQLLAKPAAPALNGEAGSTPRPTKGETLSAEELAYARRTGVSAQEYLDAKRG